MRLPWSELGLYGDEFFDRLCGAMQSGNTGDTGNGLVVKRTVFDLKRNFDHLPGANPSGNMDIAP
jgi:hypothetical protein